MDVHALTVNAVRDGPVSTLVLCGDLDLGETGGFLEQAALAVDDRTERLVFDLVGLTFLRLRRDTGAEHGGAPGAGLLHGHHLLAQSHGAPHR